MELQYKLSKPLIGDKRSYKEHCRRTLYFSSDQCCQKCSTMIKDYNYTKIDAIEPTGEKSSLEIAHIYGLRNFKNVEHGDNLFHVREVSDLNEFDNLLLLCGKCHLDYDYMPTYDKYVEMFNRKKIKTQNFNSKRYVKAKLEFYIPEMEELFTEVDNKDYYLFNDKTEVMKFEEKMKTNEIRKDNITLYRYLLIEYGLYIDEFFKENDYIGQNLLKRFSEIYLDLRKITDDRNRILNSFTRATDFEDISRKLNNNLFSALISYMIWKCEVLDKHVVAK